MIDSIIVFVNIVDLLNIKKIVGDNIMKYDFDAELKKRYSNDPTYEKVIEILNSDESKLGNDFLSLRTSLDMSQEKTAEYLNISPLNYIEIESGTLK